MASQGDIVDIVERGQKLIRSRDARALREMDSVYRSLLRQIEAEIKRLNPQIVQAWEIGDADAVEAWLRRQDWYRDLLTSISDEMQRLASRVDRISVLAQTDAVAMAGSTGSAVLDIVPGISSVNIPALERFVIAAGTNDSPLAGVLAAYEDSGPIIRKAITDGIGIGRGSGNITRAIMAQIEGAYPEWRIATVVRMETMRAYRGAQAESFSFLDDEGVLDGYMWMAAHDGKACGVCLAMDGQIFPVYPTSQHIKCRCVAVPYVSESVLPRMGERRLTGEEYLRTLSTSDQKRALGTPGRYELWTNGMPLKDLVTTNSHPEWGDTVAFTPLSHLRKAS